MNPDGFDRRGFLSLLTRPVQPARGGDADPSEIGRRDLLAIFTWIVLALVGRWKIPAQLAPAAKLVDQVITQTVQTHRAIFKGGTLRIAMRIKGWEMPEGWKAFVSSPEFASALDVGAKEEKTNDSTAAR